MKRNRRRSSHIGLIEIDDPWGAPANSDGTLAVEARLLPATRRDGSSSEGAPGWTPPEQRKAVLPINLRDNPLGRMYSKSQIDKPQYLAGCAYQRAAADAEVGSGGSLWGMRVDGGSVAQPVNDRQLHAGKLLRQLRNAILIRLGKAGLQVTDDVLIGNISSGDSAKMRGAATDREIDHWRWLFRKCLDALAQRLGYASQ
jgi:hypothetical protein